jgi:hypothetical protein
VRGAKAALAQPFNVYEVVQPIDGVNVGQATPWFGQPGIGTRYELPSSIEDLVNSGQLRRVGR